MPVSSLLRHQQHPNNITHKRDAHIHVSPPHTPPTLLISPALMHKLMNGNCLHGTNNLYPPPAPRPPPPSHSPAMVHNSGDKMRTNGRCAPGALCINGAIPLAH
jgi:hypothetical protein